MFSVEGVEVIYALKIEVLDRAYRGEGSGCMGQYEIMSAYKPLVQVLRFKLRLLGLSIVPGSNLHRILNQQL